MSQSLRILYIGPISGTCLDRANALRRLGHQLTHIDLRELLPSTVWIDRIIWKLGGDKLSPWVLAKLPALLQGKQFDLGYIDGGDLVTPKVIHLLKQHMPKVINYSIDDPLGGRDGARNRAYRQSLPFYDLCVVMRQANVHEAQALGAKKVLRVLMTADEIAHAPRPLSAEDHAKWDADVLFLGTWMPERGAFLQALIQQGVPLTIRGPNWQKAPEWAVLKDHYKGGSLAGDDYAKAIQCAKINIGMLSKGNRDLHTTRSLEIPALGGLLCAERTSEHTSMYQEGVEALFWQDAKECATLCHWALANETRRLAIAQAGRSRVKANGHFNESVMDKVISQAMG